MPVIEAFMTACQLPDVTMVADAGMISEANQKAIEAARLSFILGMRIPHVPYAVAWWRREHPGEEIPDGHIFTQPWPAGPAGKRRDQVIYYQYKAGRARRTLRGIDEQVAKAEKAVAGKTPVKRNRFVQLSGGSRKVNRALEEKARSLAGLKGYVANLAGRHAGDSGVRDRRLPPAVRDRDEQAAVLSYLRLVGIVVGSFLDGVEAGFLILEPGPPGVLSAWCPVQGAQAFDFGGVGPHDYPVDGGVQVAGGPAVADPGVQGDLGHGQAGCQVAQPPFVLGQGRAAGGDAGSLGTCGAQQVTDRGGGEGFAAFGWPESLGVEPGGDLRMGQPGVCQDTRAPIHPGEIIMEESGRKRPNGIGAN